MKRMKILLGEKTVLLFFLFVLGTGAVSAYQDTNSGNVVPNEDPYELVLYYK